MSQYNQQNIRALKKRLQKAYWGIVLSGIAFAILLVFLIIHFTQNERLTEVEYENKSKLQLTSLSIKEALEQRKDALIQKRIAEQQQEIAQQQQLLAERQRQYAVKEHLHALEQARIAEAEKNKADSARTLALTALDEAEKQKKEALYQKEIAEKEKQRATISEQNANRLMMLSVARSLAIQASELSEGKKGDIAKVLALNAFHFNKNNGGEIMEPDIYEALLNTSQSEIILKQHVDAVRGLCFNENNTRLASCGDDGKVIVWDLKQSPPVAQNLKIKNPLKIFFRCVSFYRNYLIAGTENSSVYFWNRNALQSSPEIISSNNTRIECMAYDSTYQLLYTSGSEGIISGWDLKTKKIKPIIFDSLHAEVNDMDFSGKYGLMLCACEEEKIILKHAWENAENIEIKTESPVRSIRFSENSDYLAAGLDDGTIKVYQTNNPQNKPIEIHGRHTAPVTEVKFVNDSILVSVSYDGLIKIGPVFIDQNESVTINLHNGWVYDVAISNDDKYLASCDANKSIIIIPANPYIMVEKLQLEAGRNLSREEWYEYVGEDINYQKTINTKTE